MARAEDRVGQRFGCWTIIGAGISKRSIRLFLCECDCGRRKLVASNNLYSGQTTRCHRCQAAERVRRHDARAAAMVGRRRGTLTITDWRRTRNGIRLRWACDCGQKGWTASLKGPGPECPSCAGKARARKRAAVRHAGVGYTFTDLGEMIGVSRQRATQIYREHGREELLRRAGLLGRPSGRSR